MKIVVFIVISCILWLFPILAEDGFIFKENSDFGHDVFRVGVAVVSAVWGFCYPWKRMAYIFLK